MRRIVFITFAVLAAAGPASANDGCWFDEYGYTICYPGARPGVPYYGPNYYVPRGGQRHDDYPSAYSYACDGLKAEASRANDQGLWRQYKDCLNSFPEGRGDYRRD